MEGKTSNDSYSCPFGDTENHEKLLSPVKRSLGERLFGAEATEKDSVSSERICPKSGVSQDFRHPFPSLVA
jgi:hypothetical protein